MTVFAHPEFDDHAEVLFFRRPRSGLSAIIALHEMMGGRAGGGIRMYPYPGEEAALRDVLRLSRAMTYKFLLADIRFGGAKSVIIGDPVGDKSEALLEDFGGVVESLRGRYIGGEDVGISIADVGVMRRRTHYVVGSAEGSGDTSPPTAYGVYLSLKAAVAKRLGRDDLDGIRVAIQGAGSVGFELGRRLADDGARLIVGDVAPDAVARAVAELGATAVAPEEIYGQDVDVFAPCAMGGVINDRTIPLLKATVVAGCANNQLEADRHGAALAARGILYAPDYVVNAGGAINASREVTGYDRGDSYRAIERIPETLALIFERAEREGVPTSEAADRIAAERRQARRRGASDKGD